jgi:20S proteasome subunit alpha 5
LNLPLKPSHLVPLRLPFFVPEGVAFAVEKRLSSPLLIPSSVEKISTIDDHIGVVMSGLSADGRTTVDHMGVEAQSHRFSFGEPIGVRAVTESVSDLALSFGEGQMSRPFGTALFRSRSGR